jgi:hypothetical protein
MISRRRFLLAPIALLTPLALGQETAAAAPLQQGEEHKTLPPPTNEQLHELLVKHDAEIWVLKLFVKQNAFEVNRIWQHLIPTGWWRPRLKRPI